MNWYYLNNDEVVGPVTKDELENLKAAHTIDNKTLLCQEGSEEWSPFNECFPTTQTEKNNEKLSQKRILLIASTLSIAVVLGTWFAVSQMGSTEKKNDLVAISEPPTAKDPDQSQINLNNLFFEGLKHYVGGLDDTPVNYGKASSLFDQAARQGHPPSQFYMGQCFLKGHGVEHDLDEFALWNIRSAEAGYAPAQKSAAAIFLHGMGAEQDSIKAYMWANLAASSGHQDIVPEAKSLRKKIARLLTTAQLNQAQNISSSWQPSPPFKE